MIMLDENGIISEEMKSIIENTNDIMFIKNRDFVYIAASRSFAANCVRCNDVEDVIGKTDFDLFEDRFVANKYRTEDEMLFASGKSMTEFKEEYIDQNGEKHLCLTAKYVLHNSEGKPAAIFGQYHNIGEQIEADIVRSREINRNIAASLGKSFVIAKYVDLKAHQYINICTADYAGEISEGDKTIEQALEEFVQTMVSPAYREKIRGFCNLNTIAERLKGKRQIECEYLSNVAESWCTVNFYPCEWDENNEVTHVMFAVSTIDDNIAQEIEEGISVKKNLDAIFDVAPVGIVVYEWNGEVLKFLETNTHYRELFGYDNLKVGDKPAYAHIHPEDLEGYQSAIAKALAEINHLEYVFRIWNKEKERYCWLQINAVAKPQADGKSLVYAVFTDVTERKDTEIAAEKKQASLVTALNAANQLCCEYDPEEHSINCFTETNFLDLPTPIYNYPDCLRDIDLIHPGDIDLLIDTVHSTDEGKQGAHCDVRIKQNGEYRWFAYHFEPYYDKEKERTVIIVAIIDVTVRFASIQSYKERLHALEKANEDALCMCDVNLTRNRFSNVQASAIIKRCSEKASSLDEFMMLASEAVFDPEERQEYRTLFQHKELLERFERGENHIKFEHFYRIDETNTAMVATIFDLIKEPVTGDVVGISYAKDLNVSKMSNILLNSALDKDYPMAALIYADTGEYFLYEGDDGEYCAHKQDYWSVVHERLADSVNEQELETIRENLTRENVTTYLESHDEFTYAFYGNYRKKGYRLEAKFRYVDKKHHLMLATLRNITDEVLYQQYKYGSEHDLLTGLYNRITVFKRCRELLNSYPEEQFIMLHLDVRRFHLYNTFFGEEGGNKLLCEIADVLNQLGRDYDYFTHGRIEADVFCVFFPLSRGLFETHVRNSFEALEVFSPNFPLDLAIGAYWVTDTSMPIEAMFSRATIAAKSNKKNLFGLISRYDEDMERELDDIRQITSEMMMAIEKEQFEVYLQPKYALRSGRMVGSEALVRWKHPKRGMISPGKFIPTFEKNGFIAELDRYMWEHVCQILRRWQDEGKPMYPVSVNISRVSMYSHLTVPFLKSLIEKYRIDSKYLELELTESAYMDDPEDLKRMLKELQEFGFRILMDDFGSGYSSLNTLRDLPVDVLKLDMKFLSKTRDDERGLAVLSSVVRMSKLLKLPIVAEGVEKKGQADYLRSIGCEYVQGFLYAKPMPTSEYEKLLSEEEGKVRINETEGDVSVTDMFDDDMFVPIGVLEYDRESFAYLRTNRQFLKEFNLIESLKPASGVFRNHMDETSYNNMLEAFSICSETKKDTFCFLKWSEADGTVRKYHGYVRYNGNIGTYADLSVTFMNVTDINRLTNNEQEANETNAMVMALDNTGVRMFMYYPQTKTITVPAKACEAYQCKSIYTNMPHSFADDFVYEEDYDVFKAMYYEIDRGAKAADAVFHSKDLNFCHHVTLTTVSWTEDGRPNKVFGLIENMSDLYKNKKLVQQLKEEIITYSSNEDVDDALKTTALSIGSQYCAVYYIWLANHTYLCFQEQLEGILSEIGEMGLYEEARDKYIDDYIDERDLEDVRKFMDIVTLAERIGNRNSITYTYRRKGIGWTRGQFTVGKRDESGNPLTVIYTVSDINEEIETKRQKDEAEHEAMHDSLTKSWNRKAFEQFKNEDDYKNNQVGLLVFDIDRFKGINDQYGHEIGDRVITDVAQAMNNVLRQKDLVFRMGGDEFAVLLYNCNASIWETACRKIERIHLDLKKAISSKIQVTISAGLCVSENGYYDGMYKLADQAMYNTKVNGRGGCTLINSDGEVIKEWHDQSEILRKGEVLEKNSTVTWRLDKPKRDGLGYRLYGDELFCAFVGLHSSVSPEQLYHAWAARVEPDNFDIIREAAKLGVADGKVEVIFSWKHPEKGTVQLRCSASLESETDEYYTFIGYIHVITGTHVVTMEEIDSRVKDALEEMYLANFYIRLSDYSFKVYKAQPYMEDILGISKNAVEAVEAYISHMVADESKASMTDFLNLTTLRQRMEKTNLIGVNYNDPNIGWSRAKFVAVNRDEKGNVETASLVIEAIE